MTTKRKIKYGSKELEKDFGRLTFGKLLEAYRLADELSQKEFAKILGISQASLCDLEKGRRIPSPERAALIACKLKEPESYWVQLALQDQLNHVGLNLKVSVA
ncbi:helix-turn-helix transcriptional regulator [Peredibacter starrii]|uniref:Helix-turn-helix transcriptional regulator n=1 Tax=Peredibacter starrii TaxID=28202 RepID=A0AAX4HRS3_9BACT|nr:helix-turn-helix transcriptional regulator [Peredibacter starrii]WPU65808.1 helix-turn-helix transcriptional regulator [Peredibacter starrii]